jgi:hypothetical protein
MMRNSDEEGTTRLDGTMLSRAIQGAISKIGALLYRVCYLYDKILQEFGKFTEHTPNYLVTKYSAS